MQRLTSGLDWRRLDWPLVAAALSLAGVGLAAIYSAALIGTDTTTATGYFERQAAWLVVGVVAALLALAIDYQLLAAVGPWLLAAGVVLLGLVLIVGVEINGAKAWFRFGSVALQPAELAKVGLLLTLAGQLGRRRGGPLSWPELGRIALIVGLPVILILRQPDLGTVLVFVALTGGIILWSGLSVGRLLLLGGLSLGLVAAVWHTDVLADYQKNRVLVLFDTKVDPRGVGYNLNQSLIAVGSGGARGQGWLQGTQTHLRFLPEAQTDFIFAAFCEEWGLLGAVVVLLLYAVMFWRMWGLILLAESETGRLIIVGAGALLLFHTLLNIGMVLGMLPVAGLPLPFISYGGSNLVTTCALLGLVLNVGARR